MDLSFVKEQLETFSTFAGAIKDFLQLPPQILDQLSSLSSDAPEGSDPTAPEGSDPTAPEGSDPTAPEGSETPGGGGDKE